MIKERFKKLERGLKIFTFEKEKFKYKDNDILIFTEYEEDRETENKLYCKVLCRIDLGENVEAIYYITDMVINERDKI